MLDLAVLQLGCWRRWAGCGLRASSPAAPAGLSALEGIGKSAGGRARGAGASLRERELLGYRPEDAESAGSSKTNPADGSIRREAGLRDDRVHVGVTLLVRSRWAAAADGSYVGDARELGDPVAARVGVVLWQRAVGAAVEIRAGLTGAAVFGGGHQTRQLRLS